jgi:heterogeneous nuclear ribonucleoprotein A1/A3
MVEYDDEQAHQAHEQPDEQPHESQESRDKRENQPEDDESEGKLFVGGLSWSTTEETLRSYFSKYGELSDAFVMTDPHSQRSRGFGFIRFKEHSAAEKCLNDGSHEIDSRTVETKRAVPKGEMRRTGPRTKKLFLGGLSMDTTSDKLEKHFAEYGTVVEALVMTDSQTQRSRGFGFVSFDSEETVDKLIQDHPIHDIDGKQIQIKKAEPKESAAPRRGGMGSSYGGYEGSRSRGGGGYGRDYYERDYYERPSSSLYRRPYRGAPAYDDRDYYGGGGGYDRYASGYGSGYGGYGAPSAYAAYDYPPYEAYPPAYSPYEAYSSYGGGHSSGRAQRSYHPYGR